MRPHVPSKRVSLAAAALVLLATSSHIALTASAAPAAIRVNVGSTQSFTDLSRASWAADRGFTEGVTRSSAAPIANTQNDRLYQSSRHGMSAYRLALSPGVYRVKILAADSYATRPGQRVFDVRAEGQLRVNDLDVFAVAGRNAAMNRSFDVEVRDGRLDLGFVRVAGAPAMISALEVVHLRALPASDNMGSDASPTPAGPAPAQPAPAQPAPAQTAPEYHGLPGPASAKVLSYARAASGDWVMDVQAQGTNARFVRYTAWVEDASGTRYGVVTGHWGSSSAPGQPYGVIVKAGTYDNRPPAGVQAVRAVVEVAGENPNGVGTAATASSAY